jgi:hypothetical protein
VHVNTNTRTQEVLTIDKGKQLRKRLKGYVQDEWAFPALTAIEKTPTLEEKKALADLLQADRKLLLRVSVSFQCSFQCNTPRRTSGVAF